MARKITSYGAAVCRNIESVQKPPADEWSWRREYIGLTGNLSLWESERKFPGLRFLKFENGHLKTSYGELKEEGNTITFQTNNSIYTFEII